MITKTRNRWSLTAGAALLLLGTQAYAHNPMCQCEEHGAEEIRCTGGFSDGSGAPGVTLDVISYDENILVPGKLGDDSTITFKRPDGEFYVLFDAGPGHVVEVDHTEIGGQ
ncbi:hypothetical protein [Pseudomonas sp.]|uniref:hypothetical protein n=1 Tax=Pseudomonas sp. TaxID=306 RepID=UPI003D1488BA